MNKRIYKMCSTPLPGGIHNATCKFFFLIFFSFMLTSCFRDEAYEKQVQSLDSLNGALNQKLSELKQVDTLILAKAINRYENYRQFIQQNINDTVTKAEADQLQQFYNSGKNLQLFSENRKSVLARGSLISSQLSKLIADARESSIDEETFQHYVKEERTQTELLIKSSFAQQQQFTANLQEFRLVLPGVEALIKSRNNGQMPTIIKDSIPF